MKTKMRTERGKETFMCHSHTEGKWGGKVAERTRAAGCGGRSESVFVLHSKVVLARTRLCRSPRKHSLGLKKKKGKNSKVLEGLS